MHSDEPQGNPKEDGASPPARLVNLARAHVGNVSAAQSKRGWQLLQERSLRRSPPRRWLLAAAVLPAMAAMAFWISGSSPEALDFKVTAGQWDAGQLSASNTTAAEMSFSDGTAFHLSPGTSGILGEVDAHGAQFRLKQGHMDLSVTRRSGARWAVDAGPFKISVIGTKFSVDWHENTQRLEVSLHKGEVHVSGPPIAGIVKLAVGQRLWVDVAAREVRIGQIDKAPVAAATRPPQQEPTIEPVADPVVEPAKTAVMKAPVAHRETQTDRQEVSWTKRVSAGDFAGVVASAESLGLQDTLAKHSPADLGALADAARYQRRPDIATKALLALRKRFSFHALANEAAFHLGRIEETSGNRKEALAWYTQYLKASPRGVFAAEALGRQMEGVAHLQGRSAARPLAEQYLKRFPSGDFADTAHALVEGPVLK
jgi:hypothetical protein